MDKPRPKPVIGPFIDRIEEILKQDRERPRKQRHTAKRIFDRLTHRVHILEANGESFRLKDSMRRQKR